MYLSDKVTGVQYHRISPNIFYCFITAIVSRQKSQTAAPYSVFVVLQKRTGKVESAYCNCMGGVRGYCKHCAALLHFIVREVAGGCNKTKTGKPQVWHKPHTQGKRINQPDFVRNLSIKKVTGSFETTQEDLIKTENKPRCTFDPRAKIYRKEKTLKDFDLKRLETITNGNCGLLLYAGAPRDTSTCDTDENGNVTVKTIPVIAQDIIDATENISDDEFLNNLMTKLGESMTEERINFLANKTSNQNKSQLWYDHRACRITASVAHECANKVNKDNKVSERNNSCVAKIFGYKTVPDTVESIRWGREREIPAIKSYEKIAQSKHRNLVLTETGLNICKENPWLAATPDRMISCQCCGAGCLEVKNPSKYKDNTIREMITSKDSCLKVSPGGEIHLDKKHKFYVQVQLQMYATSTEYSDFVVKTNSETDNIFIERILLEKDFVMSIIEKCKTFFMKVIANELLHRKVKLHYDDQVK